MLKGGRSVPIIGSTLRLSLVHNTGAAFGLLSSSSIILMVLATVAVLLFAVYGRRVASDPLRMGAVGLLLGGTLGNLSDRVRFGHVIDFIELSFWPTFNVADIAITIGAVLLAISLLRGHGTSSAGR